MAIYTTNNTPYKGRSLQDMLIPYLMYTLRYDDIANKMVELGDQSVIWNNLLSPTRDRETWNMVNNYNDRLGNTIADMLNGNIDLNTAMNRLQNMRREYNSWGTAVDNAYKRRLQFIDEQRQGQAKGYHYTVDANNISIDDLYKNPEMTYLSVDENNVYSHAFAGSQAASKRKISFQEAKAFGDEYYKYTKIMGMSGTEAIKTIADLHKFPELELIYKRVSDLFGFDRWDRGSFDREALDASTLSGILNGITYDVDVDFYQNHQKIHDINSKDSSNKGKNEVTPVQIMDRGNQFVAGTYQDETNESYNESNNLFNTIQSNSGTLDALYNSNDDVNHTYDGKPFAPQHNADGSEIPMSKEMLTLYGDIESESKYLTDFYDAYDYTINNYPDSDMAQKAKETYENNWLKPNRYIHEYSDFSNEPSSDETIEVPEHRKKIILYDPNTGEKVKFRYKDYSNAKNSKSADKLNKKLDAEVQLYNKYIYLQKQDDSFTDVLNKAYRLEYDINKSKNILYNTFDGSTSDINNFASSLINRANLTSDLNSASGWFKIDDNGDIGDRENIIYKETPEGNTTKNYNIGIMRTKGYHGIFLQDNSTKQKYIPVGDTKLDNLNSQIHNYDLFMGNFSNDVMTKNVIDISMYSIGDKSRLLAISDLENPDIAKQVLTTQRQSRPNNLDDDGGSLQYYVVKDGNGDYYKIITDINKNIIGIMSITEVAEGNSNRYTISTKDFDNSRLYILYDEINGDISYGK